MPCSKSTYGKEEATTGDGGVVPDKSCSLEPGQASLATWHPQAVAGVAGSSEETSASSLPSLVTSRHISWDGLEIGLRNPWSLKTQCQLRPA
ncbi:MAG: hypothetical protein ACI92S_003640 [Planctomycetaceae bacterium]|jgi:hypothetical protein